MFKTIRLLCLSFILAAGIAIAGGPVNVNTADAATIAASLDGVGESRAEAIVAYRDEHGPFSSLDDLRKVKGIGPAIIEKNKENILFSDE